ncbi:hypothetical protein VIGAN_04043300 [Vigna angularis var. angularis]|uniref:Uncharacterized protein n=1 Tax=Vigna angularis var. angularis TaxID=157739 RepID=A0A0S3RRZ6_PHAAN|nr:hypothetical protein VIGAN_04043300 [Vigna angularis var. angularis]
MGTKGCRKRVFFNWFGPALAQALSTPSSESPLGVFTSSPHFSLTQLKHIGDSKSHSLEQPRDGVRTPSPPTRLGVAGDTTQPKPPPATASPPSLSFLASKTTTHGRVCLRRTCTTTSSNRPS